VESYFKFLHGNSGILSNANRQIKENSFLNLFNFIIYTSKRILLFMPLGRGTSYGLADGWISVIHFPLHSSEVSLWIIELYM